jgi:hypothetical protein
MRIIFIETKELNKGFFFVFFFLIFKNKIIFFREMELETEIPIWFNGRVKWISNLNSRSTCSDIIEAILSSLDGHSSQTNEEYLIYECWRGVERALKSRCRLLKLWKSWGGESQNVMLTLRSRKDETIPTHIIIRQQEKKLKKLKNQIKKTDKQIEKFDINNNDKMLNYLNLSRSIIHLNNQIEKQEKIIFNLTNKIENENKKDDFIENDFKQILFDVNQTLISSRKLTNLSDQLDQQINLINQDIENKQLLLDELELDFALQENIDIDSLDDQDDDIVYFKNNSPSPPPTINIIKTSTG